jgi:hypothetical protein
MSRSLTKPSAKAMEAQRQALARKAVARVLASLLEPLGGQDRERMADAIVDVGLGVHARIRHPAETARMVCGWAGRHHPDVARKSVPADEFRDVFKRRAAA